GRPLALLDPRPTECPGGPLAGGPGGPDPGGRAARHPHPLGGLGNPPYVRSGGFPGFQRCPALVPEPPRPPTPAPVTSTPDADRQPPPGPWLIAVSARILNWPPRCACCFHPGEQKLPVACTRVTGVRVIRSDTRGWNVLYCHRCAEHVARFGKLLGLHAELKRLETRGFVYVSSRLGVGVAAPNGTKRNAKTKRNASPPPRPLARKARRGEPEGDPPESVTAP